MAPLFSLKQRQGQLVQTPPPPHPQCGCYFLISAAWNFCSCLQKPPSLFTRSDCSANIASPLRLWLAFSIPPLLWRPSALLWQPVIFWLNACVYQFLHHIMFVHRVITTNIVITQYNGTLLHVVRYGALRGPWGLCNWVWSRHSMRGQCHKNQRAEIKLIIVKWKCESENNEVKCDLTLLVEGRTNSHTCSAGFIYWKQIR